MSKKRKIHPRISNTVLDIESYHGFTPAQALEQHAVRLVTQDDHLIAREQSLHERRQELEQDKIKIEKRLQEITVELETIEELKKNYVPTKTKNFDEALHTVILRLRDLLEADDEGQWDLKKIRLDEIVMVCKQYQVPIEAVLSQVPNSLKRYIEGYTST